MRNQPPVLLVALMFAVLYVAEGLLFRAYSPDQYLLATAVLKTHEPAAFAGDLVWEGEGTGRYFSSGARWMMLLANEMTGESLVEPVDWALVWLPFCEVFFFSGTFLLARRFSKDDWACLLAACCFTVVRRAIWDGWGVGPVSTIDSKGVVSACCPLLLWFVLRFHRRLPQLSIVFLGWGFLSNLHPTTGWGMTGALMLSWLLVERFSRGSWLRILAAGFAVLAGSLPSMIGLAGESGWSAWGAGGFPGDAGGFSVHALRGFLEDVSVPLLLALLGWVAWDRHPESENERELKLIICFPLAVVLLSVVSLMPGFGCLRTEQIKNFRLIYLVMPVWVAMAFSCWLQLQSESGRWVKWGVPLLAVLIALSGNLPGHRLVGLGWHLLGQRSDPLARKVINRLNDDAADLELAAWARENTSKRSVFYFDSGEFRYFSRRPLVFCSDDRICLARSDGKIAGEWLCRREKISSLCRDGNTAGMWEMAREYHAHYLVILMHWRPLPMRPVWANEKYVVYRVQNLFDRDREFDGMEPENPEPSSGVITCQLGGGGRL
ncbi:MAG: hypothetical protein PHV34_01310 [Verrucomicrobiae bacterium]|nr:hypothetical protein [Verrucomicrobiae bacterium]